MNTGDKIYFTYKGGRRVGGVIKRIYGKFIAVILETDYKGKNDFWEIGEVKEFNIKEMKHIKIQPF